MAKVEHARSEVASPFTITAALRKRLVEAVIAQAGINHSGLIQNIRSHLIASDCETGALVAEPVIEGAASYLAANEQLSELAGNLLHKDVIAALTQGTEGDDYRFDPSLHPYRHQMDCWRELLAPDPRSILVTSGTGSGKTECFLIPLLNDLCEEASRADQRLSGVRAIMLYPLNALIASQQERLRRWTAPFDGRIRFGLYNGLTPEELREHEHRAQANRHPEQVIDRKTMRATPPQILVTNVTMLEYLTIRREDRPLIENSKGKLRWIIIDEAHSYAGSAAAEIALLLRRVLQTFDVRPEDVRFVATSATIGSPGEENRLSLRRFLSDLTGIDEAKVQVVEGARTPVNLPRQSDKCELSAAAIAEPHILASNPAVQNFIRAAEATSISLPAARRVLAGTKLDAIKVLEAIASDKHGDPLLPLRVHQFARAIPGLWSCLNPQCSGERPLDWPFGALAFQRADHCGHCQSPLFEIHSCRDCGEPFLSVFEQEGRFTPSASIGEADEFAAASESESESLDEDSASQILSVAHRRLVATRQVTGMGIVAIDPQTGVLSDERKKAFDVAVTRLDWAGGCPNCRSSKRDNEEGPMRPFRFGAPFLIGNAAAVLLDGVHPMSELDGLLPASGRRLLSFTDSRQGTARFAANIETNSERAYVRAFIYHMAQKAAKPGGDGNVDIGALRLTVDELTKLAETNPSLEDVARQKRNELDALVLGSDRGLPWIEARRRLAQDPIIQHHLRAVWEDRDSRFARDPEGFGNFLLLRELARRPRRANALETLGLARLRFEQIEKLTDAALPGPLRNRSRTIEEWRDFLYNLVDTPVRATFALDVSWEDVRWLLPRGGVRRAIVGPGSDKGSKSDLTWPRARPGLIKSNAVIYLERFLNLNVESGEDRAEMNDVLAVAWDHLRPLFDNAGSTRSLDLTKATIAAVRGAWRCPVTRRSLSHRVFGYSPYGHREDSPFAMQLPSAMNFPSLPITFPTNAAENRQIHDWLNDDPDVVSLRAQGAWGNLHDRSALLAPYLRAEEHSAQQPPSRLRAFEGEFKVGKINLLACSTTMEMGVDIGSVSSVMMTNVPPSIANYRQRVGRAGRRKQGFASSFTLARDTVLDRETFRQPDLYLKRELRPPQVKLDAPRIVQRHVNAFLLARWLAEGSGELMRIRVGAFFGYPDTLTDIPNDQSPIAEFCAWTQDPSVRMRLSDSVRALTRSTALEDDLSVFSVTAEMFQHARSDFQDQWAALRGEARVAPSDAARASIGMQLKRMAREHLLKELANRALLPGHGFPTSVVPFINDSRESRARAQSNNESANAFARRYDYPSRNADIAIREYAPGAEVVIDGLVWRSAGVTLNWQRPAHQNDVREIQSLKYFWQCRDCGAADCGRTHVDHCPACSSAVIQFRRFLEPAGFRVDWNESSHADTDNVTFIEPEPARIFTRGADWEPLLDPVLGRGRSSHEGLVFFAAAGSARRGYRLCLECGRAEEEPADNSNPLLDHLPLRGSAPDAPRFCPGGDKPFAITEPIALGHEVLTDVAEVQPANLVSVGGAWALASALREALVRSLGIQPTELGMGVEQRRGALGQITHSIFLFDRNAGGAGFSPRLFDDLPQLFNEARGILDCDVPGCERGCAACVLTADLYSQQEIVDRRAALECVVELLVGMQAPQADDAALPNARLSLPTADSLSRKMAKNDRLTIFVEKAFDLAALSRQPFETLFSIARQRKSQIRLALRADLFNHIDAAERLGLRDIAMRQGFSLWTSDPSAAGNNAMLLATLENGANVEAWLTRDLAAALIGEGWGVGQEHPVVSGTLPELPVLKSIPNESLLPKATTAVLIIDRDKGRALRTFGDWFSGQLETELKPLGLWHPGEVASISYSDRYLRSPLSVLLAIRAAAGIRDALSGKGSDLPLNIDSAPLNSYNHRSPQFIDHDWLRASDRLDVVKLLAEGMGFGLTLQFNGTEHARQLKIAYRSGQVASLLLDQGFGYWQVAKEGFDFAVAANRQAQVLASVNPFVSGRGSTHITLTQAK